LAHTAQTLAML